MTGPDLSARGAANPQTIRELCEHLGSASMHLAVLMQNLTEDSDDWFTAQQAHEHVEACIALPRLYLVPDPAPSGDAE